VIEIRLTAVLILALSASAPAAPFDVPSLPAVPKTASVLVRLFDGAGKPLAPGRRVLLRVLGPDRRELVSRFVSGPEITVAGLPFDGDRPGGYTVLASGPGLKDAGRGPMKLLRGRVMTADLMLPPSPGRFDFSGASWETMRLKNPTLAVVLSRGRSEEAARERYERLMAERPAVLAGLLGIATALESIDFHHGTALEHVEGIVWDDTMQQDRFTGYARADLLDDVKAAAANGEFALSPGAGILHPGAIISFKQTRFETGNVQLTFHPGAPRIVNGKSCLRVEVDIDKYRGLAHALLEVLPELITRGKTDPRDVYQLRWMESRAAGDPDFDPLFVLAPRP
jgi:hypothetical protein